MDKFLIILFLVILAYSFLSKASDNFTSRSEQVKEPGYGTTRAHSYQDAYEKAVKEYDQKMMSLPHGLVLPGGETVQEHMKRIEAGDLPADK